MSRSYISKALRDKVAKEARYRCGYCLTTELIVGTPMEIDHLVLEALGGQTEAANLWLACSLCNAHKNKRLTATDPLTKETVPLFNPRHQKWSEHFNWNENGDLIKGTTAIGRATILAFNLNRQPLVRARTEWVKAGWHPPKEE